jgi:hypothetical protein
MLIVEMYFEVETFIEQHFYNNYFFVTWWSRYARSRFDLAATISGSAQRGGTTRPPVFR